MSKPGDPRRTRAWRTLRDRVVKEEPMCRLQIPGICTKISATADHIIPVVDRPDLAMDRANLRGSCIPCNNSRGSRVLDNPAVARALEVFQ